MSQTAARIDPVTTHCFSIEMGSIQHAVFSECSGLQAEIEVVPYEEGGCNGFVHKLPGRTKYSNITLKRGVVSSDDLWEWFQEAARGEVTRREVSVVLLDGAQRQVKRWNFSGAYPVKWVGPAFKGGENAISIETLELAHEGITVAKGKASTGQS